VAAFVLVFTAPELLPAARAARGEGQVGWFTVAARSCDSRLGFTTCSADGRFDSDDGRVRRDHVSLDEAPTDVAVGDRIRTRHTGSSKAVYPASKSRDWLFVLGFVVASVVVLGIWATALVLKLRRFSGQ
jgi:hypothetical protein